MDTSQKVKRFTTFCNLGPISNCHHQGVCFVVCFVFLCAGKKTGFQRIFSVRMEKQQRKHILNFCVDLSRAKDPRAHCIVLLA